ncbi:hypothetical protein [Pedobacter sp. UBA4863]|uniref:hypothetical protein n=1 Tax=Pedobacter sp. UBA4863 TaxID=1947060 RepID=UPI0025E6C131|nr:hypothetical protein [Pedobacter sp. UBA4863]
MIVTSSGKLIAGNRVIINDTVNEFLGSVSNLWSNAANWSLGVVPTANHIAVIKANCLVNSSGNVRFLVLTEGCITNVNAQLSIATGMTNFGIINVASTLALAGNPANYSYGVINVSGTIGLYFTVDYLLPNINFNSGCSIAPTNSAGQSGRMIIDRNLSGVSISNNLVGITINDNVRCVFNTFYVYDPYGKSFILGSNAKLTANFFSVISGNISNTPPTEIEVRENVQFSVWQPNYQSGIFRLTTNNKNFTVNGNANQYFYVKTILIENIVVSLISSNSVYLSVLDIYGLNSGSRWDNNGSLALNGLNSFSNCIFNAYFINSIVAYNAANQNIRVPDDSGYLELRLQNSGVKKLTGNTTCKHLYFSGTATLDLNGHTLTGYTKYTNAGNVARTIPQGSYATIEFADENLNATQTFSSGTTVEEVLFRTYSFNQSSVVMNGVVPTLWRFIRQFTQQINNVNFTFLNLRLEMQSGSPGGLSLSNSNVIIIGTLDFRRNGGVIYNGASSLICSTLIFSADSQNIFGNLTFTNLEIKGTGTKTLTTNIVVNGSYYRNPATILNKNGFTIKDSLGDDLE